MPCYNAEKYLVQAIESVLTQSYTNFHLVCGNDGSTDDTAQILENYADRITVVNHPDHGNHGQAATYNQCLTFVDSEFVAFIDSDDLWHPDKLQKQVEVLDKHPEVGLVYTNGSVIDGKDKVLYPFLDSSHRETNGTGAVLLDCYIRTPSTVVVRSNILQRAGKFTVGIIPDHDMWIRMKELTDFYYINENLFCYRVHGESLSQTSTEKMWREGFAALKRAMDRYPYPLHIKRKRLAVIHYRLGQYNLKNKKIIALYHLIRSFTYDPFRAISVLKKALGFL